MTDTSMTPAGPAVTDVPEYPMPRAAGCPFDPPPALRKLQAEAPLAKVGWWDGSTPWLVTRYANQRALLADPRTSADSANPHYPARTPGAKENGKRGRTFINMDDPEHFQLRQMVTAPFSVKRVEALRPVVQEIVDGLIDDMLAGPKPADLVEAFALAVPSLVICELLGVPYSDHEVFQKNGKVFNKRDATPEEGAAAQRELLGYMDGLIADRLANPGDDLISLIAGRVKAGELSREEAGRTAFLLLLAGHETTANMIALGTLALLEHPDQLAVLRQISDPKAIADTVEEMLRYLSIVHIGQPRVAVEDIEAHGEVIHAGESLIVPIEIGNRDPEVFADPDRLDICRDARGHIAFSFGVHQCLGQNLARMELQVVYGTLYRRIPALQLATSLDQIPFKSDSLIYGVYELPVTW